MSTTPHSEHYQTVEPWQVIDTLWKDWQGDPRLPYYLGNALKYLCRLGRKETETVLKDLEKAKAYIDKAVELERHRALGELDKEYAGVAKSAIAQCGPGCIHYDDTAQHCSLRPAKYSELPCQQRMRKAKEIRDASATVSDLPYPATRREKSEHAKS